MTQILIKYINPNHVNDFIKGNIHFSPLSSFRKQNNTHTKEQINDKFEGYLVDRVSTGNNISLKFNGKEISHLLVNNSYGYALENKFTSDDSGKWGIFSCTILDLNDKNVVTKSNIRKYKFNVLENRIIIFEIIKIRKKFLKSLYKEVGNSNRIPVLIYPSFLEVLRKKINQIKAPILFNEVHYYNNYDKRNYDKSEPFPKQQMQVIFEKSSKYKNQREYRIAMLKDCTKRENKFFNIGNIISNTFVYHSKIPNIEFLVTTTLNYDHVRKESLKKYVFLYKNTNPKYKHPHKRIITPYINFNTSN